MFSKLSDKKLHLNSQSNRPKRKKTLPARFCDSKQIAKKSKVCTNEIKHPKTVHEEETRKFQCQPELIAKKTKDPKNQIISQVQQSNSSEKLEIIHDDTFTERKKVKAKKYQCESCGKKFHSKDNLNLHLSIHIQKSHGNEICKLCNKTFVTIDDLMAHMVKNHTPKYHETNVNSDQDIVSNSPQKKSSKEPKRFQCPYCKSKFSQNLLLH